jgi:hypothetical protein
MKVLIILAAAALPAAAHAAEVEISDRAAQDNPRILGMALESVEVGAGLGNYTGDPAERIAPGPAWALRATLDASAPVDVEVGYVGGINSIYDVPRAPDDPFNIYTNGLQASAKINPVTIENDVAPVRPFVLTGLGVERLSVATDPRLSTEFRSDTMGSVPLALGVDVDLGEQFQLTGRGQYDLMFDNEIVPTQASTDSDRFAVTLSFGVTQF